MNVVYLTCEKFTNEFIIALQKQPDRPSFAPHTGKSTCC